MESWWRSRAGRRRRTPYGTTCCGFRNTVAPTTRFPSWNGTTRRRSTPAALRREYGLDAPASLSSLEGDLLGRVAHLYTVNQGGSTPDSRSHVDGFRHLGQVGTFLQAGLSVRVDAVGALDGMSDGECYEGFFPFSQFALGKLQSVRPR